MSKPSEAKPGETAKADAADKPAAKPVPARDKHTGVGGHYEIRNGQRVLVTRTKRED